MKIITSESNVKSKLKQKQIVPVVVNRIFSICKEDKNFTIKQEIDEIDKRLISLKKKTLKQDMLLDQSNELEKDVEGKISSLDKDIFASRVRILEMLGSEL